MAGPGNEIAGAQDYGRLRASRADREQVVDVLKAAFTQGRLDQEEFDLRVGSALRACRRITRSFLECGMLLWYGR